MLTTQEQLDLISDILINQLNIQETQNSLLQKQINCLIDINDEKTEIIKNLVARINLLENRLFSVTKEADNG